MRDKPLLFLHNPTKNFDILPVIGFNTRQTADYVYVTNSNLVKMVEHGRIVDEFDLESNNLTWLQFIKQIKKLGYQLIEKIEKVKADHIFGKNLTFTKRLYKRGNNLLILTREYPTYVDVAFLKSIEIQSKIEVKR